MNLIEELGLEKCKQIVEGAPEWAKWWCVDKEKFLDFIPCSKCVDVNNLRTAIAAHESNHCSHGYDIACLICGFGTENGVRVWRKQIESDHCTDIRNHISPLTKVTELHVAEALKLNGLG